MIITELLEEKKHCDLNVFGTTYESAQLQRFYSIQSGFHGFAPGKEACFPRVFNVFIPCRKFQTKTDFPKSLAHVLETL